MSKLILLSAGGTGGHMFPAQALGRDLIARGYRVEIATDARGMAFADHFEGIPMHPLKAGTLGAGLAGKIKGGLALAAGTMQAFALLRRLRPVAVAGFGGYPSVPAVLAAQKTGIPTIIHQSDAVLGRANAFLAHGATRIALSWEATQGLKPAERARAVVTGSPVRPEIAALFTRPYPALETDGELRLLVMGGSLGANVFGEVVPEALRRLPAAHRARLRVVQQCRREDLETVRGIYGAAGIEARLETFFADVPEQLARAHLIISRSGASTVAEVTAAGRPAIFVPYPHHADQQQKINADAVADKGGAWVMTQNGFTPEALLTRVETFLQNPQTLPRAAEAARNCGRPDAALRLGNLVVEVAGG